jgi:hypothetical protein
MALRHGTDNDRRDLTVSLGMQIGNPGSGRIAIFEDQRRPARFEHERKRSDSVRYIQTNPPCRGRHPYAGESTKRRRPTTISMMLILFERCRTVIGRQLVDAALLDLFQPVGIGEQDPAERDEVEFAALKHRDQIFEPT